MKIQSHISYYSIRLYVTHFFYSHQITTFLLTYALISSHSTSSRLLSPQSNDCSLEYCSQGTTRGRFTLCFAKHTLKLNLKKHEKCKDPCTVLNSDCTVRETRHLHYMRGSDTGIHAKIVRIVT